MKFPSLFTSLSHTSYPISVCMNCIYWIYDWLYSKLRNLWPWGIKRLRDYDAVVAALVQILIHTTRTNCAGSSAGAVDEDSFIQAFQEVKKVSQSLFITREIVRYENIRQEIVGKNWGGRLQLGLLCTDNFEYQLCVKMRAKPQIIISQDKFDLLL